MPELTGLEPAVTMTLPEAAARRWRQAEKAGPEHLRLVAQVRARVRKRRPDAVWCDLYDTGGNELASVLVGL